MRTFTLIKYDPDFGRYLAKDEEGKSIYLDLTTDASFNEITNSEEYNNGKFLEIMDKIKGKVIECEKIQEYIPFYFVCNGRFL